MTTIHETRDYSKFVTNEFNRDIKKTKQLEESMKAHGWISAYPAHIQRENGKLKVKAGHTRIYVAKKLGIPVKYVVPGDTATIHELEHSTNPWKPADFVVSHARIGNKNYLELIEYCSRTGISMSMAASMFIGHAAGSGSANKRLKDGSFVVKDRKHPEAVASICAYLQKFGIEYATNKHMVVAVSKLLFVEEFKVETLMKKIKAHHHVITRPRSVDQAMEMLEEVYNRASKTRVPVVFLANEEAKRRSAIVSIAASVQ
jgi:hypothetical protein